MSEKTKGARIALAMRYAKPLITSIAREKLTAAGVRLKAQRDAQVNKIDAQKQTSRSEQKGANAPARPAEPLSPVQLYQQAEKDLRAKNGDREPGTAAIWQRMSELKRELGQG